MLTRALTKNQSIRNRVRQGLVGIEIRSKSFVPIPRKGKFTSKVKEYIVENELEVTILNEDGLVAVAKLVDQLDAVTYDDLRFEHKDDESLEKQSHYKACRDVNERKKTLEEALGLKLVPLSLKIQRSIPRSVGQIGVQGGTASSFTGIGGIPAAAAA